MKVQERSFNNGIPENYRQGYNYFLQSRFTEAVSYFKQAALQSYPPAHLRLYCIEQIARSWGSDLDHLPYREKVCRSFKWFQQRAEQEHSVEALFDLSCCYRLGLGVKQNDVQAQAYALQAARGGLAEAQCAMGVFYLRQKNKSTEAVKWFQLAAVQNFTEACYHLGLCYKQGLGVEENQKKAFHYMKLAADASPNFFLNAKFQLADCYLFGKGTEKNVKMAVHYHQLAAKKQHYPSQFALGLLYEKGEGIKKDLQKAVEYYQLAANQQYPLAQYYLGFCYERGNGVVQSFKQAAAWYAVAAGKGDAQAQYRLGIFYEKGLIGPKNLKRAEVFYKKAAAQGHERAKEWLTATIDCVV